MDADQSSSRKQYYKNLAKNQKKRWRRRKLKRETEDMKRKKELDRRRTGAGDERNHKSGDGLPAIYVEPTKNIVPEEHVVQNTGNDELKKKEKCAIKEIKIDGLVKIGKSIGAGTFGHCNLARYRGMIVAVKYYNADNFHSKAQLKREVQHEAELISDLGDHKNLPLLFGICTTSLSYTMALQFHGMGQQSLTVLKAVKTMKLSNQQSFDIFRGIAAGLSHIHSKGKE